MPDPLRETLALIAQGKRPGAEAVSAAVEAAMDGRDPSQITALSWGLLYGEEEAPRELKALAESFLPECPVLDGALSDLLVRPLDEATAHAAVAEILSGRAPAGWIGAFLLMQRHTEAVKGVSAETLVGGARALRDAMIPLHPKRRPLLDTCGTGGDGLGLLNLSTAAALLAASCGAAVAKHGNRAASSRTGSADLFEAWGLPLSPSPQAVARSIDELGFGFCLAPAFHPGARHAAGPRKALGFRTLFNLLGPLANPARAECQLLGVPEEGLLRPMAEALSRLGVARALVFSCACGADELIPGLQHRGVLLDRGRLEEVRFRPEGLGGLQGLKGGEPAENAGRLEAVLRGAEDPASEAVALNAGAALALLEEKPLEALSACRARAREALAAGKAHALLKALRAHR